MEAKLWGKVGNNITLCQGEEEKRGKKEAQEHKLTLGSAVLLSAQLLFIWDFMPPVPNLSVIEAVQREADSWQRGMSSDSQFSPPRAAWAGRAALALLPALRQPWWLQRGLRASPDGGCLLTVLH